MTRIIFINILFVFFILASSCSTINQECPFKTLDYAIKHSVSTTTKSNDYEDSEHFDIEVNLTLLKKGLDSEIGIERKNSESTSQTVAIDEYIEIDSSIVIRYDFMIQSLCETYIRKNNINLTSTEKKAAEKAYEKQHKACESFILNLSNKTVNKNTPEKPTKPEPAKLEPTKPEPAKLEPTKPEPAKFEPTKPKSVKPNVVTKKNKSKQVIYEPIDFKWTSFGVFKIDGVIQNPLKDGSILIYIHKGQEIYATNEKGIDTTFIYKNN